MALPVEIELRCLECGHSTAEGERQVLTCPDCGGWLDLPDPADASGVDETRRGVWRFRPRLPLGDAGHVVTLGEGDTPVIELPRWGASIGAPRAMAKLEQFAPTGSFKDRGMTLVVSRAVELGARELIEDSSGNAGASTAAYAARAELPATVYVPASAPEAKIKQIAAAGARVVRVEGPREHVTEVALENGLREGAYYVGHNVNPFFSFSMTTFAFELDPLPDHIVMPAGGGSIYVGCWRGLRIMGAPMPRMHLVQPKGCCPIVAAQAAGEER